MQLDLVKADAKPAAAALHDIARQVNEEIRKALDEDPELKRRYERLVGRGPKSLPLDVRAGRTSYPLLPGHGIHPRGGGYRCRLRR